MSLREVRAEGFEAVLLAAELLQRARRADPIDGRVAGYSLYWFDPTTKVGLVEPVRIEGEFQRQGLAKAMLAAGVNRLVGRGAERVKISCESDAAAALYQGIGFHPSSTAVWYQALSG